MIEPKSGPSYAEAAKGVMRTRSGTRFSLLNPSPEDVHASDIAEGLAKICRFTGQCSTHYSVAEHSVRVYWRMSQFTNDPRQRLAALMHDASEAYLNDMAKPIKEAMRALSVGGESAYDVLEDRVMGAIAKRFDLPMDDATWALVKRADNEVYVSEVALYMQPGVRAVEALDWPEAMLEFAKTFKLAVLDLRRNEVAA